MKNLEAVFLTSDDYSTTVIQETTMKYAFRTAYCATKKQGYTHWKTTLNKNNLSLKMSPIKAQNLIAMSHLCGDFMKPTPIPTIMPWFSTFSTAMRLPNLWVLKLLELKTPWQGSTFHVIFRGLTTWKKAVVSTYFFSELIISELVRRLLRRSCKISVISPD